MKLGWEDNALKAIFYTSLKVEVKREIINNKP
jgi:Na+/H+ antiporter NhaA